MKIVADHKIPFLKGALEPFAHVEYYAGTEITNSTVKNADALIVRTRTQCNEKLLQGSNVKFIATATIGFDHIDVDYCEKNGIAWANAPGCNSGSVMQYIASVLVRLSEKYNFCFSEKTIGIIGVGHVGTKVEKLARAIGMKVLLNDPPRERKEGKGIYVSLQEIQEQADIITFHVPLNNEGTDKTHHLFDEAFLKKLKRKPVIINSSRGEVIDEQMLKKGLREKQIQAAVLDVWKNEPNIDLELLTFAEIATPHIAGYSLDGKANGTKMAVQAISKFFNLKIDNWAPEIQFEEHVIALDCVQYEDQICMHKAILSTYDVLKDHDRFVQSPQTFEFQRGNYPARKEFFHHQIQLNTAKEQLKKNLELLKFHVK